MFRTREFEQMEIEYFVENDNDKAMEKFNEWKDQSQDFWYNKVGLNKEKLKFRDQDPDELAHYAKATTDVEYQFPRGWESCNDLPIELTLISNNIKNFLRKICSITIRIQEKDMCHM